ncbi:MAG: hypothetical protein C4522_07535 [Desulfobacteraceae bacterium]|nr:MAG: hypothetical protein C4522_07535 [Desulfobacteraceae bacterium]
MAGRLCPSGKKYCTVHAGSRSAGNHRGSILQKRCFPDCCRLSSGQSRHPY